MTRAILRTGLALLVTALGAGCGDTISVPTGNNGSILASESPSAPDAAGIPTIGVVIPDGLDLESQIWEQLFRIEASQRKVLVEVIRSPEAKQADSIRGLTSRGVASAVVVPDPRDPDVPAALKSVREANLPVVLMQRTVDGIEPPLPLVRYAPVEDDARAIVAAAVEDARKSGFPDDAEAVIVTNGPYDESGEARVAALEAALGATSLTRLPTVHFKGYNDAAREMLEPIIKEHPNLAVVLAEEEQGATSACSGRGALLQQDPERKPYLVGAFGQTEDLLRMARSDELVGLSQRAPERLARKAFDLAVALSRGESAPEGPVVIPSTFTRAAALPDPNMYRSMITPQQMRNSGEAGTRGQQAIEGAIDRPRPPTTPDE